MNLRDHFQAIYDAQGKLTPTLVVNEARDPASPLHNRFEWDDAIAGEAYRREQAHEMIQSVRIVYRPASAKASEKSVRGFHAVRLEGGYVYEPAEKVAADPFLSRLVAADMEREWKQLLRRYKDFEEFRLMIRKDLDGLEDAA